MKQKETMKNKQTPDNKKPTPRKFRRTFWDLLSDIETILTMRFKINNQQRVPVKIRKSEERYYKRHK